MATAYLGAISQATVWRKGVRGAAVGRGTAGSIPEVVLGSTQPLTDMSATGIFWEVKAAGVYG